MMQYSHSEFLAQKNLGKVQFSVNPNVMRSEVEPRLSYKYRKSVVLASGVSILIMCLAVPVYVMAGWIMGFATFIGALVFFQYTRSHNYRVFVRAQVKDSSDFYDFAVKNNVINIYKINSR